MNESAQIIKITYKVYVFSLVADPDGSTLSFEAA